MGIIKLLLSIVLIGVVGLGGLFVAENRGLVPQGTFAGVIHRAQSLPIPALQNPSQAVSFLSAQKNTLISESSKITAGNGTVLGSVSSAASNLNVEKQDPPITQRAFEYGRYIYCQQVVQDYQTRYPNSSLK